MNSKTILWVGWDSRGPSSVYLADSTGLFHIYNNEIEGTFPLTKNSDILSRQNQGMNSSFLFKKYSSVNSEVFDFALPARNEIFSVDTYQILPIVLDPAKPTSAQKFNQYCDQFNFQTQIPRLFGFYREGPAKEFIFPRGEKYYLGGKELENLPPKEEYSLHQPLGLFKI